MQVLSRTAASDNAKPPLLFLHGSFHGAWCWSEHFMDFFADRGYSVVAPSWRGTGGTYAGDGVKKVRIAEHLDDLECLLKQQSVLSQKKPVVVCHSFGGVAVMKYLEHDPDAFAGVVMMCSVPPSGNGKLTQRYLQRSLVDSWKITAGFAMKRCTKKLDLCRELFWGGVDRDYGVSDEDALRYQSYFARDSEATIDLLDLAKQLPSKLADNHGKATFRFSAPRMVLGATRDFIVDQEGVEETAEFFDTTAVFVDSPHDVMLGESWKEAATALDAWLSTQEWKSKT